MIRQSFFAKSNNFYNFYGWWWCSYEVITIWRALMQAIGFIYWKSFCGCENSKKKKKNISFVINFYFICFIIRNIFVSMMLLLGSLLLFIFLFSFFFLSLKILLLTSSYFNVFFISMNVIAIQISSIWSQSYLHYAFAHCGLLLLLFVLGFVHFILFFFFFLSFVKLSFDESKRTFARLYSKISFCFCKFPFLCFNNYL